MSEEEVLAQLRDIHVPAELNVSAPHEFALWPFTVLAFMVAAILAIRFWTRNRWRRRARAELSRILLVEDQTAQWSGLLSFACSLSDRAGRPISLPDVAFLRPEAITDAERAVVVSFLSAELRR